MARRALRSQGPTDPDLPAVRSGGTWAGSHPGRIVHGLDAVARDRAHRRSERYDLSCAGTDTADCALPVHPAVRRRGCRGAAGPLPSGYQNCDGLELAATNYDGLWPRSVFLGAVFYEHL